MHSKAGCGCSSAIIVDFKDTHICENRQLTIYELRDVFPYVAWTIHYEIVTVHLWYSEICARWVKMRSSWLCSILTNAWITMETTQKNKHMFYYLGEYSFLLFLTEWFLTFADISLKSTGFSWNHFWCIDYLMRSDFLLYAVLVHVLLKILRPFSCTVVHF